MKVRYPNILIVYLSSRTRAYTNDPVTENPEPFAFESGFAVQWTIADQINGTGNLNFDPAKGPVVAPYLSWGPYLWPAISTSNSFSTSHCARSASALRLIRSTKGESALRSESEAGWFRHMPRVRARESQADFGQIRTLELRNSARIVQTTISGQTQRFDRDAPAL